MTRHFLVIGAQRSGTTYLHSLLEAHPDIAMARPTRPEPKVFLTDPPGDHAWYLRTYFSHVRHETVLGEKSTSYLEVPAAAGRARKVLGDCDIVVVMRDPVQRAISNWRFSTDHGLESRPLAEALEANLAAPAPWDPERTSVSPYAYLERGRFSDYLPPWLDVFPGRVHLLYLDDLVGSADTVQRLYAALGARRDFTPPTLGRPVNQSSEPPTPLDPELVARLWEYFRDSDEALADLTGAPPPWRRLSSTPPAGLRG